MLQDNEAATLVALLVAMKRASDDMTPHGPARISAGHVALRAMAQGIGAYAIVKLLDEIQQPLARAVIAAGLTYVGHNVAEAPSAAPAQRLFGDTLRCAAGPVAIIGAAEAAAAAIEQLCPTRPFGDHPRVFVSHSWSESDAFFNLKERLQAQLTYLDHSVHIGKAFADLPDEELNARLRKHMQGVHVLLVLAHPRALRSVWVRKEIELASTLGKPIVAVRPHRHRNRPLHPILRDASMEQVGWDAPAIAQRISKWADIARMIRADG